MQHSRIQWPEGLDEATFLAEYWQKKPLLIRQALPDFDTPLPADELAGLSLEPETTPRLITCDSDGAYRLEYGPFEAERFETLTGNDWSLLVTDVEKHLPDLAVYLQPFGFLPSWRIDDLMVSYAPVGASVGAHVDEYDVFLLQASGSRRWSIDTRENTSRAILPDSDLRILADFKATDTWDLIPGDLLYLPPGMPHHGVACEEPCTTWSVGFRAPTRADFVMRISEMICEQLPHERYIDSLLTPATTGEIDSAAIANFARLWQETIHQDPETLARMTARFLTESPQGNAPHEAGMSSPSAEDCREWQLAPFTRVAWRNASDEESSRVQLFIDGEQFSCQKQLAIRLATAGQWIDLDEDELDADDRALVDSLILSAILQPAH